MNNTTVKRGFFYFIGPVFLYMVIEQVVQTVASVCISMSQILFSGTLNTEAFSEGMTRQQLQEALMPLIEKTILEHQVEIMGISALCAAAAMSLIFFQDRKQEKMNPLFTVLKVQAKYYIWLPGLGIALCMGMNCFMLMSQMVFADADYQQVSQIYYQAGFPIQVLCLGIIIPVTEELVFRGILFKRYRAQVRFRSAALFSAVVFALMHSNVTQLLYTFFLGIFFAYVYEKYQSLKAPVLLHITFNLVSLIATKSGWLTVLYHSPGVMAVMLVICAFTGAVMFVLIRGIHGTAEEEAL